MLRPGQLIVLCVLALLTLGLVMVNSAGMSVDPEKAVTLTTVFLNRTTAYMALALAAMAFAAHLPIARLRRAAPSATVDEHRDMVSVVKSLWPLWAATGAMIAVLGLVYLPGLGREVNYSSRWIGVVIPGVGEVRAQPSEIAKWALIALMAWYGWRWTGRIGRFWHGLMPALIAVGAVAAVIAKEDLGTGVLVASAAAVTLIAAGARIKHLALLSPLGLLGVASLIWVSPYRWQRLTAFWDPYADPRDTGYHMIQSMAAVSNGQVFGQGLGHGLNKFGYLPEDTTDFLFAVICEELGVAGAALVAFLYAGLLLACVQVIRHERHHGLKLLGVGVMATIGLQAAINLFVVTGMGPTKGIALPLLSSGGTGWILTAAMLGLLVAMDLSQSSLAGAEEHGADDEPSRPMIEARPLSPVMVPMAVAAAFAADAAGAVAEGPAQKHDTAASEVVGEYSGSVGADDPEPAAEPATEAVADDRDPEPAEDEVTLFREVAESVPLSVVVSEAAKHWPDSRVAAEAGADETGSDDEHAGEEGR